MSLRSQVLAGLFWTGGMRLLSQILTWAVTIVVIRLLSPGDYGLLAMATIFVGFLALVAEAGLGSALVQAPELDDLTLRRIFGAVILIDFALFALQFAAAPAIAHFFDEEHLVAIIRVLALQFLLMIFGVIPTSLLARKLDFRRQSMVGMASAVVGSLSTLGMAIAGYGVWALVFGSLVTQLFNTVAINAVLPFLRWPDFSLKGMRGLLVFGGQVTAARIMWFFYSQADIFIVGKLLGKELLGFYSISMHLGSLPVQKISSVINQVAYPAFAQTQHRPDAVRAYMLKSIRLMSFFAFPVLWGVSSISQEIVAVLLGPKWQAAVVPLQLLPLVMPITMFSTFLNTAFQGVGRSSVVFSNVFTAFVVMPAAFWIGAKWGLPGLCFAWLIGLPLVFLVNLQRMLPLVGLKSIDVLAAMALPALAAGGMYACVGIARLYIATTLLAPVVMVTFIAVGTTAYAIITLAANRNGAREVMDLFRKSRDDDNPI